MKWIDSTDTRCSNKSIDDPCTFKPGYTWHKFGIRERIYIVRGKDRGCPAWHYVLVVDDQDIMDKFKEKIASGNINVADQSGWGEDPSNDVQEEMEKYETS